MMQILLSPPHVVGTSALGSPRAGQRSTAPPLPNLPPAVAVVDARQGRQLPLGLSVTTTSMKDHIDAAAALTTPSTAGFSPFPSPSPRKAVTAASAALAASRRASYIAATDEGGKALLLAHVLAKQSEKSGGAPAATKTPAANAAALLADPFAGATSPPTRRFMDVPAPLRNVFDELLHDRAHGVTWEEQQAAAAATATSPVPLAEVAPSRSTAVSKSRVHSPGGSPRTLGTDPFETLVYRSYPLASPSPAAASSHRSRSHHSHIREKDAHSLLKRTAVLDMASAGEVVLQADLNLIELEPVPSVLQGILERGKQAEIVRAAEAKSLTEQTSLERLQHESLTPEMISLRSELTRIEQANKQAEKDHAATVRRAKEQDEAEKAKVERIMNPTVQEEVIIPNKPRKYIPYILQGDLDHYNQSSVERRIANKYHPEFIARVKKMWQTQENFETNSRTGQPVSMKGDFVRMLVLIYAFLNEDDSIQPVASGAPPTTSLNLSQLHATISADLSSDLHGGTGRFLTFVQFHAALFQLIDAWTVSVELAEYLELMDEVYDAITKERTQEEMKLAKKRWLVRQREKEAALASRKDGFIGKSSASMITSPNSNSPRKLMLSPAPTGLFARWTIGVDGKPVLSTGAAVNEALTKVTDRERLEVLGNEDAESEVDSDDEEEQKTQAEEEEELIVDYERKLATPDPASQLKRESSFAERKREKTRLLSNSASPSSSSSNPTPLASASSGTATGNTGSSVFGTNEGDEKAAAIQPASLGANLTLSDFALATGASMSMTGGRMPRGSISSPARGRSRRNNLNISSALDALGTETQRKVLEDMSLGPTPVADIEADPATRWLSVEGEESSEDDSDSTSSSGSNSTPPRRRGSSVTGKLRAKSSSKRRGWTTKVAPAKDEEKTVQPSASPKPPPRTSSLSSPISQPRRQNFVGDSGRFVAYDPLHVEANARAHATTAEGCNATGATSVDVRNQLRVLVGWFGKSGRTSGAATPHQLNSRRGSIEIIDTFSPTLPFSNLSSPSHASATTSSTLSSPFSRARSLAHSRATRSKLDPALLAEAIEKEQRKQGVNRMVVKVGSAQSQVGASNDGTKNTASPKAQAHHRGPQTTCMSGIAAMVISTDAEPADKLTAGEGWLLSPVSKLRARLALEEQDEVPSSDIDLSISRTSSMIGSPSSVVTPARTFWPPTSLLRTPENVYTPSLAFRELAFPPPNEPSTVQSTVNETTQQNETDPARLPSFSPSQHDYVESWEAHQRFKASFAVQGGSSTVYRNCMFVSPRGTMTARREQSPETLQSVRTQNVVQTPMPGGIIRFLVDSGSFRPSSFRFPSASSVTMSRPSSSREVMHLNRIDAASRSGFRGEISQDGHSARPSTAPGMNYSSPGYEAFGGTGRSPSPPDAPSPPHLLSSARSFRPRVNTSLNDVERVKRREHVLGRSGLGASLSARPARHNTGSGFAPLPSMAPGWAPDLTADDFHRRTLSPKDLQTVLHLKASGKNVQRAEEQERQQRGQQRERRRQYELAMRNNGPAKS